MFTYTNISNQDLEIPNVGVVKAGENIDSEYELYSPFLEPVTEPAPSETNSSPKTPKKETPAPPDDSTPSTDTSDKEPVS